MALYALVAAVLALTMPALIAGDTNCQDDWKQTHELHNQYRAMHGAAPLDWHPGLAANAQYWAEVLVEKGCKLEHSGPGENLYANLGFKDKGNCVDATKMWYAEGKNYKYTSSPLNDNSFKQIGHFTQMVWKNTNMMGCGSATNGHCVVVACQYLQWGNGLSNAQFVSNVGPLQSDFEEPDTTDPPPEEEEAPPKEEEEAPKQDEEDDGNEQQEEGPSPRSPRAPRGPRAPRPPRPPPRAPRAPRGPRAPRHHRTRKLITDA